MLINLNFTPKQWAGIGTTIAATCLFILFSIIIQWHNDWKLAHEPLPTVNLSLANEGDKNLIDSLSNYHLFGKALPNLGKVPISNLQLSVVGIAKAEGETLKPSRAYISMQGQMSKIYQVGDAISGGVKVYDITPFAVILENDGHLEKLPLSREKLQFKARE